VTKLRTIEPSEQAKVNQRESEKEPKQAFLESQSPQSLERMYTNSRKYKSRVCMH
jgi:hypothetical protein